MSESIKSTESSNQEKTINLDGRSSEVPPFDPETAKKAREKKIAEYKAEHPNAVDSVSKAYAMAKAGDEYETEAAELRAQKKYDSAKVSQIIADMVEEAAGENYDKRNGKSTTQRKAS